MGYWSMSLTHVICEGPRILVQFYGPGFCPRLLLAWDLGLGSWCMLVLLAWSVGQGCWPTLLTQIVGPWSRFFAWVLVPGFCPRLLTHFNAAKAPGSWSSFMAQVLAPGYWPGVMA